MAEGNKPRGFSQKKKLGVLAVAGIVVGLVVVLSLLPPTPSPVLSPPGAFNLSSNAGAPDTDGTFTLSWTAASGATSYTVYEHTSFITAIDGSVTSLGGATGLSKALAGKTGGVHYYAVQATNADGTKLSNCLAVGVGWQVWTWMDGSNAIGQAGAYGTKGVPGAANTPGARSYGASWTSQDGMFWFFGGFGNDSAGNPGRLNDLWRFDPASSLWTWVSGSNAADQYGIYGTMGIPSASNIPGAREHSVAWASEDGNLWLFGGFGNNASQGGLLNDLWRFNTTSNQWTWMGGSNWTDQCGTYGIKGTPNTANFPGGRTGSVGWVDSSYGLWLFGGNGYPASGDTGYLNDLWRYEPSTSEWVWITGSDARNQTGTYGTMGTPATGNTPGARDRSMSWMDANGDLWLFGGYGYTDDVGQEGFLQDLWWYDASEVKWAWMNGSESLNIDGTYGTKGTPGVGNNPGARYGGVTWVDGSGDLCLFGGTGYDDAGDIGDLNDLWRIDPASSPQWTWVSGSNARYPAGIYGTMGVPGGTTVPGGRFGSVSWMSENGGLWLFGGSGYGAVATSGNLNDLFVYFPTILPPKSFALSSDAESPDPDGSFQLSWTAAGGADTYTVYEYNSFITTINSSLTSLGEDSHFIWDFSGKSDGTYYYIVQATNEGGSSQSNCLAVTVRWNAWAWMSGSDEMSQFGVYGTKGIPSAVNIPGGRSQSVSWTRPDGILWLFGGYGNNASEVGTLNDLWRYNPTSSQWTWMSGSQLTRQYGTYGTKGVADTSNTPGGRYGSVSWVDAAGDLWLFGGINATANGRLNDLWRFNMTSLEWTWVNGSDTWDQYGTYGTKGVADAANTPGGRTGSVSWVDATGNLWIFGGYGFGASGNIGRLNDLWRFHTTTFEWTWMNGSNAVDQYGTYGTKGEASGANTPGGRSYAESWVDPTGDLWLFGGWGYGASTGSAPINDLWHFNTTSFEWTWVNGSDVVSQFGTYGTKGEASGANTPGGRFGSVSWVDAAGDLWLFGGNGYSASGGPDYLNDLWRFDTTSFEWTWVNGSDVLNQYGIYGTPGVPALANTPGSRYISVSWVDAAGYLWLFGGQGYAASGSTAFLNDLWRYHP